MESWLLSIPVGAAFAAVFTAGVSIQQLRNQNERIKAEREEREALERRLQAALEREVARLEAEHQRSSGAQGGRIGELETSVGGLIRWQQRTEGAELERERRRTLTGAHKTEP